MLLLASTSQACSSLNPGILVSPMPQTDKKESSIGERDFEVLFEDFSDPTSGWETGEYSGGSVGYSRGEYSVISKGASQMMWGQALVDMADVVLEVNARQARGPENDNTGYGVMCRVNYNSILDTLDAYVMQISGDGYFAITKFFDDESILLVDWTPSDLIRKGSVVNTIKAICEGDRLILYVNGVEVVETSDSSFSSGDIALAGTSFEETLAEFRFDNLRVNPP